MSMLLLLTFTSAALLGTAISETGCALPTTIKILELIRAVATSIGLHGTVTSLTDHHYTCQAVGSCAGLFRYLSIAVKYSVTLNSQVDTHVSQIQLECNTATGNYRDLSLELEVSINESLVFSIPTRRDCRTCAAVTVAGTYDADTNCAVCSTSCLGMGQGACSNVYGTDCCPYYGVDGMCLKNCSTNTVTANFTCVPAPSGTTTATLDNTTSDTTTTAIHFSTSGPKTIKVSLTPTISTVTVTSATPVVGQGCTVQVSLTPTISTVTVTSATPVVGQGCTVQVTVAAFVSGVLSAIAISLIASCIMCCVVLRGRQKRKDTFLDQQQGIHQQEIPSTELVEYEVPVVNKQEVTTQDNVAYGGKISLQQNVAYEQVHMLQ